MVLVYLISYGQSGFAQSVGYLKVLIPQQNKAHNTSVTLKLNGTTVLQFSHASSNDSNLHVGLSTKGLATGNRTPISSDYSALQKGCQFDYRVQFSLDNSMWIDLGQYRAPSNNLMSYIPIGICNDGNVCSDSPIIKGQIEKQREILKKQQEEQDRKNIEALKAWLEQTFTAEKSQDLSNELNSIAEFGENPELVSEEKSADIEGLLLNQGDVAHSPTANETLPITNSERVAAVIKSLNQKMGYSIPPYLMEAIEKLGLPPDILLNYGWIYAGAMGLSYSLKGQISQEQIDVLNGLKKFEQTNFLTYHQDGIKESLRFMKYWDQAKEIGELGLRLSPMGDLIDFCELVIGREFCKSNGQFLSSNQRFLAAVGIVVGNRQFNGFIESELKTLFKEIDQVLDKSGKIKWSKVFSEVETGELIKQDKTELIEQLRKDKNIPKDWQVGLSSEKDGISFSKEGTKKADEVRIMSGNPKNPNFNNQKPYVKYKKNGQWLNKDGRVLTDGLNDEAHIPIDEFEVK